MSQTRWESGGKAPDPRAGGPAGGPGVRVVTGEPKEDEAMAAPWAERVRLAPLGVVLLGVLLFVLGAGLVLVGFYIGLSRADTGWVPWVGALLAGPVVLYASLHILRLTHWSWLATIVMLALLLLSAVARALSEPGVPVSAAVEIVVEVCALAYLARRSVRRAFGWR